MTDEILTLKEALKLIKMSRNTFFEKIKTDAALQRICKIYDTRNYRIKKSDILAYFENQKLAGAGK